MARNLKKWIINIAKEYFVRYSVFDHEYITWWVNKPGDAKHKWSHFILILSRPIRCCSWWKIYRIPRWWPMALGDRYRGGNPDSTGWKCSGVSYGAKPRTRLCFVTSINDARVCARADVRLFVYIYLFPLLPPVTKCLYHCWYFSNLLN